MPVLHNYCVGISNFILCRQSKHICIILSKIEISLLPVYRISSRVNIEVTTPSFAINTQCTKLYHPDFQYCRIDADRTQFTQNLNIEVEDSMQENKLGQFFMSGLDLVLR